MRGLTLALVSGAIGGALAGCGASAPASDTGVVSTSSAPRSHTSAVTTAGKAPGDPAKPAPVLPRLVWVAPTHDTGAASTCYGACATAWPPYLLPRKLPRGSAYGGLVGTIRRTDGRRQVTYAGHPLYHYVGDLRPGQVLCQGVTQFGGGWYVVAPSGHLIR